MNINLQTSAKAYIALFGLVNYLHVLSFQGSGGIKPAALSPFNSAPLDAMLFLTYIALPIVSVFIDSYPSYIIVTAVCVTRIPMEFLGLFMQFPTPLIVIPLYAIGAIFSLALAVEKAAAKASGEILRLKWSQF